MSRTKAILDGDVGAAARLMRDVDDRLPSAFETLGALYPHTGRAQIVGITGNPGSGKSTLVDRLVELHRKANRTVGVVAVDPSSPYTGGAILGDRIRMQRHAVDPGVFIRSLATRGQIGGLSRACVDVTRILDAMGFELILIETVGVGQDEIEVTRAAHTTVVVTAPGLGDEVQAIKAGILEVADVLCVNKADRDGADATVRDLEMMLALANEPVLAAAPTPHHAAAAPSRSAETIGRDRSTWEPPILKTVASTGKGVAALAAAIDEHAHHLLATGEAERRARGRAHEELLARLRDALLAGALEGLRNAIDRAVQQILDREIDPYQATDALLARLLRR